MAPFDPFSNLFGPVHRQTRASFKMALLIKSMDVQNGSLDRLVSVQTPETPIDVSNKNIQALSKLQKSRQMLPPLRREHHVRTWSILFEDVFSKLCLNVQVCPTTRDLKRIYEYIYIYIYKNIDIYIYIYIFIYQFIYIYIFIYMYIIMKCTTCDAVFFTERRIPYHLSATVPSSYGNK